MKKSEVNGYILAGGKSSRMGMDKGLMLLNGKAVVQQMIEQIQPAVANLVIVSGNASYQQFGLEVIGDLKLSIGPAGGIHSALSHTDKNHNFIVSCDMPFITTNGVRYIIESSGQSQITLPEHEKTIEPLFGVYSKECLAKWESLILGGEIKLHNMISNFKLTKINVNDIKSFENYFFSNINTMKDFENATQYK